MNLSKKRLVWIIGGCIGAAIIVLVVVLSVVLTRKNDAKPEKFIGERGRLDCLPKSRMYPSEDDESNCLKKGCIYDGGKSIWNAPKCYYNTSRIQYRLIETRTTTLGEDLIIQSVYGQKAKLVVSFELLTSEVMRFKIAPFNQSYYEVPIKLKTVNEKPRETKYKIEFSSDRADFYFKIVRRDKDTLLWDTSISGLIFEKNFIQIASFLPGSNIFGLGENRHQTFKHDILYKSYPIFSRDQSPGSVDFANLYGAQPFFTCMASDGKSHGVLLYNSNPMEYEIIPAPGIVFRVFGGILDFYVFTGPGPEEVIQQYTDFIGKPFMPPYWSLGYQLSRYGYENIAHMKEVYQRVKSYNIPLDTMVADVDHLYDNRDFTIDEKNWPGFNNFLDQLFYDGVKSVIISHPAFVVNDSTYEPYTSGFKKNVFIKWPNETSDFQYTNSTIMVGYCMPTGRVAYPDFFKKSTEEWWIDEITKHWDSLSIDGIWIDMNEMSVFGTNDERPWNWPESDTPYWSLKCNNEYEEIEAKASYLYKEFNKLSDKTLCMNARLGENDEYAHFDVHNLYGHLQSIPSYKAVVAATKKRGFVLTRSNFVGTGVYAGHWTGDNDGTWVDMHFSIISMLEYNLFGIPYIGSDICGYFRNATDELCLRWHQLGAFYPFSRNHNGFGFKDQDPGAFGPQFAARAKSVLEIRYELLPYLYTLFYNAHTKGGTVARPLFHEFPRDTSLYSMDKQFLWGSSLMICPVLEEKKYKINVYFPLSIWYDYYNGKQARNIFEKSLNGIWKEVDAPIDQIPLFVRGGAILPTQTPANTTEFSRKNPFGLIVALDANLEADGELYFDDGDSLDYKDSHYFATYACKDYKLTNKIVKNTFGAMGQMKLEKVRLLTPLALNASSFRLNSDILNKSQVEIKDTEAILKNLNIKMTDQFTISWEPMNENQ